jgi:putative ABC transport system permease protein
LRSRDLLGIALSALYQQRVRTLLSVLGVAIGTFALALSLSVGQGVEAVIVRQLRKNDQLRRIELRPGGQVQDEAVPADALKVDGPINDARRARLRKAVVEQWSRDHNTGRPKSLLTAAKIAELRAMPGVESATPTINMGGQAVLDGKALDVSIASAAPDDSPTWRRLVDGEPIKSTTERTAIVSEFLLYRFGVASDEAVKAVIGRKIRLEYRASRWRRGPVLTWLTGWRVQPDAPENKAAERLLKRLPAVVASLPLSGEERTAARILLQALLPDDIGLQEPPIAEEFTIVGVIREFTDTDPTLAIGGWASRNAEVLIPPETGLEFVFRSPENAKNGIDWMTLKARREEDVKGLTAALKGQGYWAFSLVEVIEQFRWNVVLITFAVAFIAAVALVVAAVGITNTMAMSVLERTREIGVMKAVGARDRQVLLIFLVEGALIGLVGGGLGLLASFLASYPGDAIARSIMEQQTKSPPDGSLFVFPLFMTLGIPAIACAVATLAAWYPARRAVRVNPVTSLRHE